MKKNNQFYITKELHLNHQHNPHANELNEHYCRKWLATNIITDFERGNRTKQDLLAKAQLSKYYNSSNEYFCLAIAFPNISNKEELISVTIGFQNDRSLKRRIHFIDDKAVTKEEVNITCERCGVEDCAVRAVEANVFKEEEQEAAINKAINTLLNEKE